jgi:hypothetical protein
MRELRLGKPREGCRAVAAKRRRRAARNVSAARTVNSNNPNATWLLDVAVNEHERDYAATSNTLSVCCLPMVRGARVETVLRSTLRVIDRMR